MANDRIYLLHRPSGYHVFLGKRMGWGWYGTHDTIQQEIAKLFAMMETQEAEGDQDDLVVAREDYAGLDSAKCIQIKTAALAAGDGKP